MTNILEKALLVAFGVFIITSFLWFLGPFLNIIIDFNNNDSQNITGYTRIINQIDFGINYIIDHPNETFSRTIEYPKELNITFFDNLAKFYYIIEGEIQIKIIEYTINFFHSSFNGITPGLYLLEVFFNLPFLYVNIN
ncbi:MAG: hypothetical protein ACFFAS_18450 [Promethearchaeota archaeon]